MEGNEVLGIKIGLDFESNGASQAKLNEAIEKLQADARKADIKLGIDLDTEKAQAQLKDLKVQLDEAGETFKNAFAGLDVSGIERVVAKTKEIQETAEQGAENIKNSMSKATQAIAEGAEKAGNEVEGIAKKYTLVKDATGETVKVIQEYTDALGRTVKEEQNLGNASRNSSKIIIDNAKDAQKAYADLEKVMKQITVAEKDLKSATEDGMSKTAISSLEKRISLLQKQKEEIQSLMKERNLENKALKEEIDTKQKINSLESKYNNEVAKEEEKLATVNKLLEERFAIQQRIAKDNYTSQANKDLDIARRDELTSSINNRKKNLSDANKIAVNESLAKNEEELTRIKNDVEAKNAIALAKEEEQIAKEQFNTVKSLIKEEQSLRLANLDEENSEVKALNDKRLLQVKEQREEIGTSQFSPEQIDKLVAMEEEGVKKFNVASARILEDTQKKLLNQFKTLLNEEKSLVNKLNSAGENSRENLGQQQAENLRQQEELLSQMDESTKVIAQNRKEILQSELESIELDKEQNELLTNFKKNLSTIAQLRKNMFGANEGGDYQLSLIEKETQLLEKNADIYSQLKGETLQLADELQKEASEQENIVRLKQQETQEIKEAQQAEREQVQLQKQYMATLKEETSLRNQKQSSVSEERILELDNQINSVLSNRAEIYARLTEESQSKVATEEEAYKANQESLTAEKEEQEALKTQATLYKELLNLELQRIDVQTRWERTSSLETNKIKALVNEYKELTNAIKEKNNALSSNGLVSSELEKENAEVITTSDSWRKLKIAETETADASLANADRIRALGASLTSLSDKYGRTITSMRDYKGVLEGLNVAKEIGDADQQAVAIENLSNRIKVLGDSARETESKAGAMFNSVADIAKTTAIITATSGIIGSFNEAWENIKKINHEFTELKKVYDPAQNNGYDVNNFKDVANQMGSSLGYNTADTLDAIYQAMNYGYANKKVAEDIAKDALILSNSGQISEQDASKYIISILRAYGINNPEKTISVNGTNESAIQSVIDQLSFGGMNFPITSGGIGQALQRGGSALSSAGNSLQQSIEMIIAGNQDRQDPATVGNSMKSIAGSFIQLFLGNSKTNLRKRAMLESLFPTVKWFNSNGQLNSTFDIMTQLSKLYEEGKITPNNVQLLADILGGKTQLGVVTSVLKHLASVNSKYGKLDSLGGDEGVAGSALRENEKYLDSIQGRLTQLHDSTDKLWMDILKTGNVDTVIEFGNKIVNILDLIINKIGVIRTVALGLGAFMLFHKRNTFDNVGKAVSNIAKSMANVFRKMKGLEPYELSSLKKDPNEELKEKLNQEKLALTSGEKVGESYSKGIATGIIENNDIEEALKSKLEENNILTTEEGEVEKFSELGEEEGKAQAEAYQLAYREGISEEELAQVHQNYYHVGNEINTDEEIEGIERVQVAEEELEETTVTTTSTISTEYREMMENIMVSNNGLTEKLDSVGNSMLNFTREVAESEEQLTESVEESTEIVETRFASMDEIISSTAEKMQLAFAKIREGFASLGTTNGTLDTEIERLTQEVDEFGDSATVSLERANESAETYLSTLTRINEEEASRVGVGISGVGREAEESAEREAESGIAKEAESGVGAGILGMTTEGIIGTATMGIGVLAFPLIMEGINKLISANANLAKSNEEVYSKANEGITKYSDQINQLSNFENSKDGQRLEQLNNEYQAGKLNNQQTQDYFNLLKNIAQIAPETVAFKGANGNPYINMDDGIKGVISDLKQLQQVQEATLVDPKNVDNFWKQIDEERSKAYYEQRQYDTSNKLEDNIAKIKDYQDFISDRGNQTGSDLAKIVQEEESDFNQAEQHIYSYYQKYKEANQKIINDIVNPHIEYSPATSGLSEKIKEQYKQFMDGLNLSGLTEKQVNDIFSKMDSNMDNEGARKIVTNLTQTMNSLKQQYALGKIDYSQFADGMRALTGKLVNGLHLTPEEANEIINTDIWKRAETSQTAFVNSMRDTTLKLGTYNSKLISVFQNQYGAMNSFLNHIGDETKNGQHIIEKDLEQMFTVSPEAGHALEQKLGISLKMPLQAVVDGIGKDPKLQTDFQKAMQYILTGKPVPKSVQAQLTQDLNNAIAPAVKDACTEGEKSAVIRPKVLSDLKAGATGEKDGQLYAGGAKITAKEAGQILHALGVTGVAYKDGALYANGVKLTAKQAGQILADATAGQTGNVDGMTWKTNAHESAVTQGTINTNAGSASSAGHSDALSYVESFASCVWSGIKNAISSALGQFQGAVKAVGNGTSPIYAHAGIFMAIPQVQINTQPVKTQISKAHAEVHSFATSLFSTGLMSSRRANSGGIGGGKGGKGGKGSRAVGFGAMPTNFASFDGGYSSFGGGTDTSYPATGIADDGGLNSEGFAEAGSEAGMAYATGFAEVNNYVIQDEITQTERLQEIQDEYFNNDSKNLKLSIDLNQRLNNAITDVGNAIEHNQALQEQTDNGYKKIDLLQQELDLLEQKKVLYQELQNSDQKQLDDMQNSLAQNGFTFDSNGDILNAVSKLQQLERWVNSLPDKVTEEKTKKRTHYVKVPYTYEEHRYRYEKEPYTTERTRYRYERVPYTYHGYRGYEKQEYRYEKEPYTEQQTRYRYERVPYTEKETRYRYVKQVQNITVPKEVANKTKEDAKQAIQNLQNMVKSYEDMLHNTIPQTENSIDQLNEKMRSVYNGMLQTANNVEQQITQIIQKEIEARKQAIQNEANAQVKALNQTLQNLENKHNQQQYQNNLKQQYENLQQIQEQINDAELDHSLNGQARVAELKKQLQAQQQQINETISNQQYQNAQNKIQNEINAINNNAKTAQDNIDKTWTVQKIAETVQQAMLTGKFKDVSGNIVSVRKVWEEFANEFDNGLGVMGNKIKDDFITQLEEAQKIMENIKNINSSLGYYDTTSKTPTWATPNVTDTSLFAITPTVFNARNAKTNNKAPQVNINAPLIHVNGNVGNASDLHNYSKDLEKKVTDYIVTNLRQKGYM